MVLIDTSESLDLADPLVGHPSFYSSSLIRPLSNPNLGSLVSHLKPMALKNPDSLVNQGRSITGGSMDLLESDKTTATASEEKSEAVNAKKHQERRPARDRKRAKFSAKLIPSQSDASLEPSMDVNKLQNPDEFFETFEKMENAKKELQRQKGQPLVEIDNNRISLSPRRRRPSIFNKSATYKHRSYSLSGVPNNDEAVLSSQEAYDHRMTSPTPEDPIPETVAMTFSPQTRVSETKPAMSTKVSELDELLSCDFEGLDADGVQNILQDKLNIKLVDIGRPSLPDMPDVRRREYASSIEALPYMKDSVFHLNDSSKAASSKPFNFSYQLRKGSNNQVSPTLCKSPLASISSLNKHISRLTPSNDPFSPLDIDSSPEMISYPGAQNRKQPEQIGKRIDSHEFSRSPINEEETNEAVTSPPALAVDSRSPNIESEEQLGGISHIDKLLAIKDSHIGRSQNNIAVTDEKLPSEVAKDMPPSENPETWMDGIRHTAQAGMRENLFEIRSPTDGEDNMAVSGEPSLACAAKDMDVNSGPTEEDQIAGGPESVGKKAFNEGSAMGNASGNGGNGEMDAPLNTQGILTEKPKKKTAGFSKSRRKETAPSSTPAQENIYEKTVTAGRKKKAKSNAPVVKEPKNKKRKPEGPPPESSAVKSQLRRHSLYAAGTKWEAGLRRSTRIKMRPLEFWRGERLLYGRVHNSVVSVIGVKYASPTKGEDGPGVKVKSFVSDEYKDLLDLASSH